MMKLDYNYLLERLDYTLRSDPVLNPESDNNTRYINQLVRQRFIPGAPFPAVTLAISDKEERHLTMGYAPAAGLSFVVDVYCSLPSPSSTGAIKTLLGVKDMLTGVHTDSEANFIVAEIETWLRGDSSTDGLKRRKLNTDVNSGMDIKVVQPVNVVFSQQNQRNMKLTRARITLSLPWPFIRIL
jgi:hypothetical protein